VRRARTAAMTGAALPFASLPMYDVSQLSAAWDRLWELVRAELAARGIEAALLLRRDAPHSRLWRDPDLLLGQTCGWPLVSQLGKAVVPFARFDFGLDTRKPGDYFSVFIRPHSAAPAMTLKPRELAPIFVDAATRIAVNGFESQSGYRVLGECLLEPMSIGRDRVVTTGGHLASIRAVARGEADLAAIDATTWQLALEHEPVAQDVAVVARSADAPGLPLITSARYADKAPILLDCLTAAAEKLGEADRAALHLRGVVSAFRADYEVLMRPPLGNFRSGPVP